MRDARVERVSQILSTTCLHLPQNQLSKWTLMRTHTAAHGHQKTCAHSHSHHTPGTTTLGRDGRSVPPALSRGNNNSRVMYTFSHVARIQHTHEHSAPPPLFTSVRPEHGWGGVRMASKYGKQHFGNNIVGPPCHTHTVLYAFQLLSLYLSVCFWLWVSTTSMR